MQRGDYKNALNELQLSSKFCEKMEKMLTECKRSDEDEYEDVVTHVDVVKPRRFHGLATAAAFVIAAGAVGGGAIYKYNEKCNTVPDSQHMIYDDYYCHFPFATLPLHDAVFNVNDRAIESTVIAFDSIAKKLYNFFENAEWTEVSFQKSQYNAYYYQGISFTINNYSINITSDNTVNVVRSIYKDSEGNPMPDDTSYVPENGYVDYEYYAYSLPEGSYNELLKLLLEDRISVNADIGDFNIRLLDAEYHTEKSDGVVSEEQAFSLSYVFNLQIWKKDTTDADLTDNSEPITLKIQNDEDNYLLSLYKNSVLYISRVSDDGNATETTKYHCDDLTVYSRIRGILNDLNVGSEVHGCPINVAAENAVVIRKENGEDKAYLVEYDMYEDLVGMIESIDWIFYDDIYRMGYLEDGSLIMEPDEEKIAENENTFKISIDGQLIIVNDNCKITVQMGNRYNIDKNEYMALSTFVNDISGRSMDPDEFADWFIDNTVKTDNASDYYYVYYENENANNNTANDYKMIKDVEGLRETMISFEWIPQEEPEFDESEHILFAGYNFNVDYICIDKNGNMQLYVGNKPYYFKTDDIRYTDLFNSINERQ